MRAPRSMQSPWMLSSPLSSMSSGNHDLKLDRPERVMYMKGWKYSYDELADPFWATLSMHLSVEVRSHPGSSRVFFEKALTNQPHLNGHFSC